MVYIEKRKYLTLEKPMVLQKPCDSPSFEPSTNYSPLREQI